MKYITTDKHPELKEGLILESNYCFDIIINYGAAADIKDNNTMKYSSSYMLEKGYIKEVQEKDWTDADMIEFTNRISGYWCDGHSTKSALNEFKKLKS